MSDELSQLELRVRRHELAALADYLMNRQRPLLAFIENQLGARLRSKIEAIDVFQETSVEAVRSLEDANFDERGPFGWLCQIAERRIIDAHRRFFGAQKRDARREVSLGAPNDDSSNAAIVDLLVASMTTPTEAISRDHRQARLAEALADLPAEQSEVLRLRYLEGLPSKEIATRLGKSDGAVRVMLTRSLARLQKILLPQEETR